MSCLLIVCTVVVVVLASSARMRGLQSIQAISVLCTGDASCGAAHVTQASQTSSIQAISVGSVFLHTMVLVEQAWGFVGVAGRDGCT